MDDDAAFVGDFEEFASLQGNDAQEIATMLLCLHWTEEELRRCGLPPDLLRRVAACLRQLAMDDGYVRYLV